MKTAIMDWRAEHSPSSPSRRRPKDSKRRLTRIKEYATPRRKRLLVVEDNPAEQLSIRELLGHDDIDVTVAATGAEALEAVGRRTIRLRGARSSLPDMSGFEVLEQSARHPTLSDLPVLCSPAKNCLRKKMRGCIRWRAASWSKAWNRPSGCSMKRLCSCIAWSPICRRKSRRCSTGCTVPMRRWWARRCWSWTTTCATSSRLSSVLERRGMTVLTAGTGREAIAMLESTPDVAIVLMDIMMPEMDGYETMQVIRQNAAFRRLPIIALTAKAMKGDREKCLEAGASEYLAKPVNTEQLLSALAHVAAPVRLVTVVEMADMFGDGNDR